MRYNDYSIFLSLWHISNISYMPASLRDMHFLYLSTHIKEAISGHTSVSHPLLHREVTVSDSVYSLPRPCLSSWPSEYPGQDGASPVLDHRLDFACNDLLYWGKCELLFFYCGLQSWISIALSCFEIRHCGKSKGRCL